jgi:hypothetical protein
MLISKLYIPYCFESKNNLFLLSVDTMVPNVKQVLLESENSLAIQDMRASIYNDVPVLLAMKKQE